MLALGLAASPQLFLPLLQKEPLRYCKFKGMKASLLHPCFTTAFSHKSNPLTYFSTHFFLYFVSLGTTFCCPPIVNTWWGGQPCVVRPAHPFLLLFNLCIGLAGHSASKLHFNFTCTLHDIQFT